MNRRKHLKNTGDLSFMVNNLTLLQFDEQPIQSIIHYKISMQSDKAVVRAALHAGSWYTQNKTKLAEELTKNLEKVELKHKEKMGKIKAIIGPHAGYRYSGPVAAWSYKYLEQLSKNQKLRIFLLGPSHYKYLRGISISSCTQLETPIGNLPVDTATVQKLKTQLQLIPFSKKDEEKQHSLQMHMPYIRQTMGQAKVVPIIVGDLGKELFDKVGKILAPYFDDQNTVFIVSSDFCHWGEHFDFQPFDGKGQIWQYIKNMDHQGMHLIEKHDKQGFAKYLADTENTICGRNPIQLLMSVLSHSKLKTETKFIQYDQSQAVRSMEQSSVSYAASITYLI